MRLYCVTAYPSMEHPFLKDAVTHQMSAWQPYQYSYVIVMFLWNLWRRLCSMGMTSKRLTKCRIQNIAEAVSGEVLVTLTEVVLERISAALYVTTFADGVAFMETFQWHKEDFSLFIQHIAICHKEHFEDELTCKSTSIVIIHRFTSWTSLRVFMHYTKALIQLLLLTTYALLCHFRKGLSTEG